jgi:hypothetical protein
MEKHRTLSALLIIALAAVTLPGVTAQPSLPPGDITPGPGRPQQEAPPAKSDEHRIVGKVLHIDTERGLVKLETAEGVLTVQPPSETLRVFRVGDTVSVPRSGAERPSASPRQ